MPKGEANKQHEMEGFDNNLKVFENTDEIEIDKMSEPDEFFTNTNFDDANYDDDDNDNDYNKMNTDPMLKMKTEHARKMSKTKSKPWQNLKVKKNYTQYYRNKVSQRQVQIIIILYYYFIIFLLIIIF